VTLQLCVESAKNNGKDKEGGSSSVHAAIKKVSRDN
jgi:hypothetical protein